MLPSFIIFLIVLSILVFVHEIGHFLAAKKTGVKVEEFGFGYPPKLWGKKIGETIYSINWIPFGGFVKLLGQEPGEKISPKEKKRSFFGKSKAVKALILLAGVFGNFVLGVVCFSIIYSKIGIPQNLGYIRVVEVVPGGPAELSGLKKEDKIVAVDTLRVSSREKFVDYIEKHQGKPVMVKTDTKDFIVTPRENPPSNEGWLGVMITDVRMVFYPWWQTIFLGTWQGIKDAMGWSLMILQGLGLALKMIFRGVTPEVSGPLGIYELTTMAAKQGILELIQFVGIFSINLMVINLMPFPALDGGHLLLTFTGHLLGKKRRAKIESILNTVGFILIFSLMILITISELLSKIRSSPLMDIINNFDLF